MVRFWLVPCLITAALAGCRLAPYEPGKATRAYVRSMGWKSVNLHTHISLVHRYVYIEVPKAGCGTMKATLGGLDPEKVRSVTFGRPPHGLNRLFPGRNLLARLNEAVSLELAWSGLPLWLWRP